MNMAKGQGKTGLIVTIVALALTVIIVGTIVLLQNMNRPAVTNDASTSETTDDDTDSDIVVEDEDVTPETPTTPEVDPSTLTSVDIEPLAITVFYTKGTPGFDFVIKRTADSTQYVEFSSPDLIGTKCTDDEGVFASIIKNTKSSIESSGTVSQKVGFDRYDLSLAGQDCTSNIELLREYQAAFSNGFSELKAMDSE
jgi:hypothetical protein